MSMTNMFIAAEGHYGNKSKDLIRDYATSLGFKYLSACDKDSFNENLKTFLSPDVNKSIILEDMCRDSWNWQKNNPEGYK